MEAAGLGRPVAFLLHILFGLLGAIQLRALGRGPVAGTLTTTLVALACIAGFTLAVSRRRARPILTLTVTTSFGVSIALSPLLLRALVLLVAHGTYHDVLVALAHAMVSAFLFGAFLMTLVLPRASSPRTGSPPSGIRASPATSYGSGSTLGVGSRRG